MLAGWAAAQLTLWAFGVFEIREALQLDAFGMGQGEYWRLLTHQLFHANALHLVANLALFYYAGRDVEPIIGRRSFAALCITAGLLGGVANWIASDDSAVLGYSAATAAMLAAYATILPELEQTVPLYSGAVLRFRTKWLVVGVVGLAGFAVIARVLGVIGPAGILAGCVAGWVWARWFGFGNQFAFQRRRAARREREARLSRMEPEEFIAAEVDPILEKIAREGIGSLTRDERRRLEDGRAKLVKSATPKH